MRRKIKPKSCRDKGRLFEFWVRQVFSKLLKIPLDCVLLRSKSASGTDVYFSPPYKELYPFGIECKNRNKLSFWKVVEQAKANAEREDLIPLIVAKRKTDVWISMPIEVFFTILFNRKITKEKLKEVREEFPLFSEARFSEKRREKDGRD